MFDELKLCPFCGGEAVLFVENGVRVVCPKCGATSKCLIDGWVGNRTTGNAVKSVITAWNRRVKDEDQK